MLLAMTTITGSSVELSARWTTGSFAFARLGLLLGFIRVEPAFFAAADAAMGPQSFQNHFRCRRCGTGVVTILHA
jgi:hypothetical protein